MSVVQIPSRDADQARGLRPMLEAKAGYGNETLIQKIMHAVGTALSHIGSSTLTAGMAIVAVLLLPVSLGALDIAVLLYPVYLALAGSAMLLSGEIAKHMSDRQVAHLTFSA